MISRLRLDRIRERLSQRIVRDRTRLARRILPARARVTHLTPAPMLEPRHVEGCRVLTSFAAMISEYLPKHAVVAEVGTFRGDSARAILEGAKPRELHLIDRDFTSLQRRTIEPALRDGIVQLHEDDSVAALASFSGEYFDWIHIDGDNSYPGVKRDIKQAQRALKPNGLLVFHNYLFFSHNDLVPYGVIHAVNELCITENWSLRYLALQPRMYCHVAVARLASTSSLRAA